MEINNLSEFEKFTIKLKKKMKLAYPGFIVEADDNSVSILTGDYELVCKYNNKQKAFFAFSTEQGIKITDLDEGMSTVFKFCKMYKFMQEFN